MLALCFVSPGRPDYLFLDTGKKGFSLLEGG